MPEKRIWIKEGSEGPLLILAHGAGAPMDSPFMTQLSAALVKAGVRVWRFEFSYMAQRRQDGRRRPPPPAPRLLAEWRAVLADPTLSSANAAGVFIGGKSLGGRLASLLAAEQLLTQDRLRLNGCLCFGYPFHPPAKPAEWRTGHFPRLQIPTLIAQGERDPFGRRERVTAEMQRVDVAGTGAGTNPYLFWVPDGDHDLVPRKRSDTTWKNNLTQVATGAATFMHRHG